MADEHDESGSESGKEFRQKFEALNEENKVLRGTLAQTVAEKHGLKPEDLADVPVDQMATKAAEIAEQKEQQRQQLLRESLEAHGLSGEDLESALAKLVAKGETPKPAASTSTSPFASTGSLGGTPPASPGTQGVHGIDRIRAAMVKNQ